MVIAFITSELNHPWGIKEGGLGEIAMNMIKYLSTQSKYNVYVFTLRNYHGSSLSKNNTHEITVDGNIKYYWVSITSVNIHMKQNFRQMIRTFNAYVLNQLIMSLLPEIDILHVHDWMSAQILIELSAIKNHRMIKAFHLHSTEKGRLGNLESNYSEDSMSKYTIEVSACHAADYVIAVSEKFREEIEYSYGVPRDKLYVILNAIDFKVWSSPVLRSGNNDGNNDHGSDDDHDHDDHDGSDDDSVVTGEDMFAEYGITNETDVILFCGRMVTQKDPNLLFTAFTEHKISRRFPRSKLVFMGDGHKLAELRAAAEKLDLLNTSIIFLGNVQDVEKRKKWYSIASLLVVCSKNEPFGIIFLESISMGTIPLTGNNLAVTSFLTPGQHILTYNENDKNDLAENIIKILSNKSIALDMVSKALPYIKSNFNLTVLGKNLCTFYDICYRNLQLVVEGCNDRKTNQIIMKEYSF